ncbi:MULTISPECIES: NADH-dependent [FeFe] hydrogenase, group A6 [unclassified Candidatus Frackibacter]|uniref:NADH-dependent [FeFe] hydrogenase, group A6 n=1 Tax=unclassified Candidatus Frackibacter TaxID=2648818 RepID=UPI00079BCCAA|nr:MULTISPECIES: NADH-dependent [FeFe] hydrogenase, group A6 [unclassified Candidatus Frackibacter]KXS40646.1 MAG: NADH-quinone oxidoreductase subunit G [Candidatus Frackibacter sp. T328-2]SDC17330.1 NAD(P)-dependent iron-only hydrogenase catalytic subunit [Candidatus Frackibacter sp. WG11]SEM44498.1 NAD(P)-dependent iron-only hydrogenase catalytic subunit [Candidatus Frackibacter sp. WG12]SFL47048.1 NAD(P)-dependent iron-only hydrogenase catalytic subunit [Candidatus Frackibacter sp. WG13]
MLVTVTIDGQEVEVSEGTTILDAADMLDIDIPTLCYLKELNEPGACRVCLVDVEGDANFQPACVYEVTDGLKVRTNTPQVIEARKRVIELLLSDHPFECLTCVANQNCELQSVAKQYGIRDLEFGGERNKFPVDDLSPSLVREPSKCILCRRCISVCAEIQEVHIYDVIERGFGSVAAPAYNESLMDTPCITCGQCIMVCPTGALHGQDDTQKVWDALADESKHVVIQTAPAIRVTIGEMFGLEIGSLVTGQLVAALKRLGFDKVFDDCFGADVVVMEEGHELMERLESGKDLPQFTSCCPGWVKFCESFYPSMLDNLSSCKSPQQVFGALAKSYYAEQAGIDPEDIFCVSTMPCVAKKYESQRPEMDSSGHRDVDAVLTTRELGEMIKQIGLDIKKLPEEDYDEPMGYASGAGVIFGSTGGVMEAALRTVYERITGERLEDFELKSVRGRDFKEAEIDLKDGRSLKVAVARGTGNARRLIHRIMNGEAEYDFIEVMACPAGGCVGGGGQPIYSGRDKWLRMVEDRAHRAKGLFEEDGQKEYRVAHENPFVKKLYDNYLGDPHGERSQELLHTSYVDRQLYTHEERYSDKKGEPMKVAKKNH